MFHVGNNNDTSRLYNDLESIFQLNTLSDKVKRISDNEIYWRAGLKSKLWSMSDCYIKKNTVREGDLRTEVFEFKIGCSYRDKWKYGKLTRIFNCQKRKIKRTEWLSDGVDIKHKIAITVARTIAQEIKHEIKS